LPHFILTCIDKKNGLEARMAAREAHLAYVRGQPEVVKLGGPLLDDDGQMAGSILVIDVADKAAAQAFADKDPYGLAGVFESVDIRAFKITIGTVAS
jgi:uncharacterized protein YciI